MSNATATKAKGTKPKAKSTAKRKGLAPPFRPGRQNIVTQMFLNGMTRQEVRDALPAALKAAKLGTSRNVASLINTTFVGLGQLGWRWKIVDGVYKFTTKKEDE